MEDLIPVITPEGLPCSVFDEYTEGSICYATFNTDELRTGQIQGNYTQVRDALNNPNNTTLDKLSLTQDPTTTVSLKVEKVDSYSSSKKVYIYINSETNKKYVITDETLDYTYNDVDIDTYEGLLKCINEIEIHDSVYAMCPELVPRIYSANFYITKVFYEGNKYPKTSEECTRNVMYCIRCQVLMGKVDEDEYEFVRDIDNLDFNKFLRALFPALKKIHLLGYIHRDIKFDNVVYKSPSPGTEEVGGVKIIDFGISIKKDDALEDFIRNYNYRYIDVNEESKLIEMNKDLLKEIKSFIEKHKNYPIVFEFFYIGVNMFMNRFMKKMGSEKCNKLVLKEFEDSEKNILYDMFYFYWGIPSLNDLETKLKSILFDKNDTEEVINEIEQGIKQFLDKYKKIILEESFFESYKQEIYTCKMQLLSEIIDKYNKTN